MALGIGLVLAGLLTGWLWIWPPVAGFDQAGFFLVNHASWPTWIDKGLAYLRPLGSTVFYVVMVAAACAWRPAWSIPLVSSALAAELVAKLVKAGVRRDRPFMALPEAQVRLPRLPVDMSYPSADAMRAGFLATAAWVRLPLPLWAGILMGGASMLVALGRVRSGVHYPTDVWAGWWIGLGTALAGAAWVVR